MKQNARMCDDRVENRIGNHPSLGQRHLQNSKIGFHTKYIEHVIAKESIEHRFADPEFGQR